MGEVGGGFPSLGYCNGRSQSFDNHLSSFYLPPSRLGGTDVAVAIGCNGQGNDDGAGIPDPTWEIQVWIQ